MSESTAPKNRIRPRARLMRTLGQELISNEVVGAIELVKNAYDADATRVLIRFVGPLVAQQGHIEVIDNGHGMTLDTIQTVFLEPATISKRETKRSEKYKRRYLGEKGIGRFASARLAEELVVFSRREGSPLEAVAFFDWRQFDDDTKFLDEIEILSEEREPKELTSTGSLKHLWEQEQDAPPDEQMNSGTVLRMSSLRQGWSPKQFEELTRGLSRLVAPIETLSGSDSSRFEIVLELPEEFQQFSRKIEPPPILQHPHYIIAGTVDSDGTYSITYRILSTGAEQTISGKYIRIAKKEGKFELRKVATGESPPLGDTEPISCGPVAFELRVWDRDELGNVVQKTNSTIRDIRRDLDSVAGINIYRDGFRVMPYGEPQDDWLRLDLRRVQNPTLRISNNQLHGVISISADGNPQLRDQSNREGLDENQAVEDLRGVMTDILSKLEELRYAERPRTDKSANAPTGGLFSNFDLQPLAQHISALLPGDKQTRDLIDKTEAVIEGQLKEIQTVLARYQRLSTLGQLIDHVLHEARQPIASINNEAFLGLKEIGRMLHGGPVDASKINNRFSVIRKQGDVLAIAFKRMEPFGGRRRGRPSQLYLEEIIRDSFEIFQDEIDRLKVVTTLPMSQTLVRLDPAEIHEVIVNLLQNSLYWLQQIPVDKRSILVTIKRHSPDHLDIGFSDSGPGVPQDQRDLIFDPYFSTRADGVGLGLAIVGEIVTDYYGGSLELLKNGPLSGANFLITLRRRV